LSNSLRLDVPIPVVNKPELDWIVTFDGYYGEGVHNGTWIDPALSTLMLLPVQFSPGHSPSPMELSLPPADWELVQVGTETNKYAMSKNGSTEIVQTSSDVGANTPLVFTLFVYGQSGLGTYPVANLYFGQYTLTILSNGYSYIGTQGGYISAHTHESLSNRWLKVLVMPYARRYILIYSDAGGYWLYKRLDLSLTNHNNTIISAGKAKFQFPSSKALCRVELAAFPSYGTYITPLHDIGTAPQANQEAALDVLSDGGAEVQLLDEAGNAFQANGTKQKMSLKFTLSGGASTPVVYAGTVQFAGTIAVRQGSNRQSPGRNLVVGLDSASFLLDPMDDGVPHTNGWPTGMSIGASVSVLDDNQKELFLGLLGTPVLIGAQAPSGKAEAKGLWSLLEHAVFRTSWRLDGMKLSDIVLKCLRAAGLTELTQPGSDDRVEVHEYSGPHFPGDPRGLITLFPVAAGMSVAKVLQDALDLWMPADWDLAVRQSGGKQKVYFGPKSTTVQPVKTFWRSPLKAGWQNCYWSNLQLSRAPRSADGKIYNEIVVRGRDPDGGYIYSRYVDARAQDPNLSESDRPQNWFGGPVIKYQADDRLWTKDACDHVRDVLRERLNIMVEKATWTSDYDPALTEGSVVTLEGHGKYRITSIVPLVDSVDRENRIYVPTEYTGEKVS